MNDSSTKDTLEVEVTDFGPIARARIDLRPLTVFVGPSNTGKSYLAVLIYALHRHFNRKQRDFMFWHPENWNSSQTAKTLAEWRKNTFADKKMPAGGSVINIPNAMRDAMRCILDRRGKDICEKLRLCFGMDNANALIRKGSRKDAFIGFRRHESGNSDIFKQELAIGKHLLEVNTTIPEELRIRFDKNYFLSYTDPRIELDEGEMWYEYFIHCVEPRLFGPLDSRAFYLPADRTGIMHAHSTVVSAIVGNAPMAGLRPGNSVPMLSGVLATFLQELIDLGHGKNGRRRVGQSERQHNLDKKIEASVLDGSVRIDRSGIVGYPNFLYRPKGWKDDLPLMHASSMVSELAPVVLYLRHVIQPGDVLIIEEPEAHLHPALQVEFTRQLAALVHAGIRVVVTTHSEWVLETVANLVQASRLSEERRKGIEGAEPALRPDQVGAWLFKSGTRSKGSVVQELELDTETGLFQTDFDPVSEALYNAGIRISNRLLEDSET